MPLQLGQAGPFVICVFTPFARATPSTSCLGELKGCTEDVPGNVGPVLMFIQKDNTKFSIEDSPTEGCHSSIVVHCGQVVELLLFSSARGTEDV